MPARANRPISVTLGPLAPKAEARVKSGQFASLSEVVRAGLRALEREEAMLDRILAPIDENDPEWREYVRRKVHESLSDARPPVPAEEAFARLDNAIAEHKARRGW